MATRRKQEAPTHEELERLFSNQQQVANTEETGNVFPLANVPLPEEEETAADRVAVMLAKGRGKDRAVVKIKKYKEDGELAWCADMTPERFEQSGNEGVRRAYGPGKYELTLYANNPSTGRFSRYGLEIIEIMPALEPEKDSTNDATATILERVLQRLEAIEHRPTPDPTAEMQRTFALVSQMREAFGLNQPQQPAPQPHQKSPTETLREMLEIMEGVKTLREAADTPEPDTSLPALGLKALETIGAMFKQQQAQMVSEAPIQSNPIPTISAPPSIAIPAQQVEMIQPKIEENETMKAINEAITGLNIMAGFSADATSAAEMIYEKAPVSILELLESPDWFGQLSALAPSVVPHEVWYRRVHVELMKIIEEEAQGEPGEAQTGLDNT